MRGKVTIDFNLPGKVANDLKDIASKAFQVAFTVLARLDEVRFEGTVEIIKITWKYTDSWTTYQRPSKMDFQVVFNPFLWGQFHEKFQVIARWYIGGKTVSIYEPEDPSRKKEESYLNGLSLPDETVNALAGAVIEAMKTIIGEKQAFYERAGEKLAQNEEVLVLLARGKKAD